MRAERLSSVFPISGAALWQAASVVSCAASASNMKIDSSITLLPPHSPHTHKHTNLDPSLHWHSCCVSGYQYVPFFCLPLISCLHFLLFYSSSPSPSFAPSPPLLSLRVTWRLVRGSRAETSTTPWCCTTTTARAGPSRSSCPSPSTCSGAPTSASSSGTAPVSGNGVRGGFLSIRKRRFQVLGVNPWRCCCLSSGWFSTDRGENKI